MDALSAFLSSLGPYGALAAFGLGALAKIIHARMQAAPVAPSPGPAPAPVPVPVPAPSSTPIIDAILNLVRSRFTKPATPSPAAPAPVVADIDHATAAELLVKLFPPKV